MTQDNAWWRLQLPGVYRVSEIEVTNNSYNGQDINGVEILIGISPQNNGNNNPRYWCRIVQCRGSKPLERPVPIILKRSM